MSKQLDSILTRVTTATPPRQATPAPATPPVTAEVVSMIKADEKKEPAPKAKVAKKEQQKAIQAYMPESLVKALNVRAAEEGTTVRSLLLQGLKQIGMKVPDEEIRDRRKS